MGQFPLPWVEGTRSIDQVLGQWWGCPLPGCWRRQARCFLWLLADPQLRLPAGLRFGDPPGRACCVGWQWPWLPFPLPILLLSCLFGGLLAPLNPSPCFWALLAFLDGRHSVARASFLAFFTSFSCLILMLASIFSLMCWCSCLLLASGCLRCLLLCLLLCSVNHLQFPISCGTAWAWWWTRCDPNSTSALHLVT